MSQETNPTDTHLARLLDIALREATEMTAKTVADHALHQLAGWSLDEAKSRLLFADGNGRGAVMAAQVVGLYDPAKQLFEWAWNNSTFRPHLIQAVNHVRGWGEANALPLITQPVIPIDATTAMKIAAFTARLIDWPGVYRGTGGSKEIYLAFAPTLHPEGGHDRIAPVAAYALSDSL